jgi:enoyl-CoA hydratase/3-hydroxyacyl-CoA dehydrogenase
MVAIDKIKNIAVIGSGLMGTGIAQVALLTGYDKVTIIDLNAEILERSRNEIENRIAALESEKFEEIVLNAMNAIELVKTIDFKNKKSDFKVVGILAQNFDTNSIMRRLKTDTDISKGISDADFVIEAVPEILPLKQDIFKKLGQFTPPHTILATNTSSLSITKIAQYSNRPENVIGMHFHTFYPLLGMLIEITPGERTSQESLELGYIVAQNFPCLLGERFTAKLEKETPGLIANRISLLWVVYYNWILEQAISKGISYEQLDAAGMSFELLDRIGVDTMYSIYNYFEEVVSPDFAAGSLIRDLINEGRLGRKMGRGYYEWDENGPIKNLPPVEDKTLDFLAENVNEEYFLAFQLNEACRLLEEGVIKSYKLIDNVLLKGTFVKGPFLQGKKKYKEWSKMLHELAERTGKSYLNPCKMMESGRFLSYK